MTYLKNKIPYTSYVDPVTRFSIPRGAIVAVKELTVRMRARIRARGLVECSEEEYNAYVKSLEVKVLAKKASAVDVTPPATQSAAEVVPEHAPEAEQAPESIESTEETMVTVKRDRKLKKKSK